MFNAGTAAPVMAANLPQLARMTIHPLSLLRHTDQPHMLSFLFVHIAKAS